MTTGAVRRPARLLFHVQHLLGVGHVFRARRLIEGLSKAGHHVEVVFGGPPLADMAFAAKRLHLLPPIAAASADYSVMLKGDGAPLDAAYQQARAELLVRIFEQSKPDMILVEQYPFGRRMLRPEMLALLRAAARRRPRPLVVCSVRDILQEGRKPGRVEEAAALVREHFDLVLVHSDPDLIRLDETFPPAGEIADKLRYTGIVTAGAASAERDANEAGDQEHFDVIVSVGGGAFGADLLRTARAAADLAPPELRWCLVTGPNMPGDVADELKRNLPARLSVKTFLPDLRGSLQAARLSISQAGYNTVADVLAAGCRAVLVPYDVAGQTEQLRRATLLQRAGRVVTVPQSALTPESLVDAVGRALRMPPPHTAANLDGVANSVAILGEALQAAAR